MGNTGTVLLADDSDALRETFEIWLEPHYDVRSVPDGAAALDAMDGGVDAAVLDRRMPERSGEEVVGEFRRRGLDVPVVFLSAEAPDYEAARHGFERYVTKPVTRSELHEAVEWARRAAEHAEGHEREFVRAASARAALDGARPATELVDNDVYDSLLETETALEPRVRDAHPDCENCPVRAFLG
jgi:CheY-like chemotaxis protein